MEEHDVTARIRETMKWASLNAAVASTHSQVTSTQSPAAAPLPLDPLPLPEVVDRNVFVEQAYRVILGRDASPAELLHQARLLRFFPFWYTRRAFLSRLRESWEAAAFQHQIRLRHEGEWQTRHAALEQRIEQSHAQLRVQIQALQRSLTEVSYDIVEDIVERQKVKGESPCAS